MEAPLEHLCILSPTKGTVSDPYCETFGRLSVECFKRRIALSRIPRDIPGWLEHARNTLCADAVRELEPTHYLWNDVDGHYDAEIVFDAMARPEDCIARAYPQRNVNWERLADRINLGIRTPNELRRAAYLFGVAIVYENGRIAWSGDGRLMKVRHLGFGWVLFKAAALRSFLELTPGIKHGVDWASRPYIEAFAPRPVDPGIEIDGGEDTSFFDRWRRSGREVWLDPWEPVGNGSKFGAYIEYLRDVFGTAPQDIGLYEYPEPYRGRYAPPATPATSEAAPSAAKVQLPAATYDT